MTPNRHATVASVLLCLAAAIAITSCSGGRRGGLESKIEELRSGALSASTAAQRAKLRCTAMATIDSLLTEFPEVGGNDEWLAVREELSSDNRQYRATSLVDSLVRALRGFDPRSVVLRIDTDDLAGSLHDFEKKLDAVAAFVPPLLSAREALDASLRDNHDAVELGQLKTVQDSLEVGSDLIYGLALSAVQQEIKLMSGLATLLKITIEEVWGSAISSWGEPSVDVRLTVQLVEMSHGRAMDEVGPVCEKNLALFDPKGSPYQAAHGHLVEYYLSSKALLDLGRSPKGSLLAYHEEAKRLLAASTDSEGRFQLEIQKVGSRWVSTTYSQ